MPELAKPKIYVLDDEHTIAQTCALILKSGGFDATAFTSPLDALQAAESQPPAMLVADLLMPQLNGVEIAVRFRTLFPECRVILISGVADARQAFSEPWPGDLDVTVLAKPVDPRDFLATVRQLLNVSLKAS